jgi:hypothetical protein
MAGGITPTTGSGAGMRLMRIVRPTMFGSPLNRDGGKPRILAQLAESEADAIGHIGFPVVSSSSGLVSSHEFDPCLSRSENRPAGPTDETRQVRRKLAEMSAG